uniref:Uncharacterized protein n=1 Tax=Schizaphis graminum TaxID=13262 RepID=A0A2S2NXZ3_SCHGA
MVKNINILTFFLIFYLIVGTVNAGGFGCIGGSSSESINGQKKIDCEKIMVIIGLMYKEGDYNYYTYDNWREKIGEILVAESPVDLFLKAVKENKLKEKHNSPASFCTGYAKDQLSYL